MSAAAVMSADSGHLLGRLALVEERIRLLVEARRADDPQPEDPFRGLYLSDDGAARVLDRTALPVDGSGQDARVRDLDARMPDAPLLHLARTFGLGRAEQELLLTALICELDPRFEQLFGYLNDDVTRRRPSVAVALELCGLSLADPASRAKLVHGPLVSGGLLDVQDTERPFPSRCLHVPDRVAGHLLGDPAVEPLLQDVLMDVPDVEWGDAAPLAGALLAGCGFAYLREPATGSGVVLAASALRRLGRPALVVDLARLATSPDSSVLAAAAVREARLSGAGLVGAPLDAVAGMPRLVDALMAAPQPLLLVGSPAWDPAYSRIPPLLVDVPASTSAERLALWEGALGPAAAGVDLAQVTSLFRLRPEQVGRAAASALAQTGLTGGRLSAVEVSAGARAENGSALDQLARRVVPGVGWNDLVLPPAVLAALKEVSLRARHREQVLGDWAMRPGGGRGHGVAALFAGDSGTGKTMSAEVVARELGLELYVVDLATVVDKYIGETEKNLERIFTAAAGVNGVLLFDEADAIFGKRSEVRDAHDRYANIESAYLLQRMETFDGLAILATNLRANIDDAFTRRLDVMVDFPLPDAGQRTVLWDRCLGRALRRSEALELDFMGTAFELAGGAIRSAAVTAAYLAADDGGVVTMAHLVAAVEREYRKLGRLMLESEFGRYWPLVGTA